MPAPLFASPRLEDRLTRRGLLKIGGVGALGLGLTELLHAGVTRAGGGTGGRERNCIYIVQYGGGSHIDSFDLKPDAPDDIRGPYRPIDTAAPGVQIGELLPQLALLADKFALVRSMTHGNGGHDGGTHVAMTGHSQPAADTPYFGSVVSRIRPTTRNLPSYVWIQNLAGDVEPRYLGGGFLGPAHSPLRVATDEDTPAAPGFRFTAFDPPQGVSPEQLLARQALLDQLDASSLQSAIRSRLAGTQSEIAASAMSRFQQKAFDLVAGDEARAAFDLEREPAEVRDRYGRHPLGQNLLMARRLVEAGVRLVNVVAWTGLSEGEKFTNVQTWDMHGPVAAHIGSIFGTGSYGLGFALPRVDQSVSALLEDLDQRGMLDNTLVVMVGEFGRSPRVSNQGRDHWPACYSSLLAGAGIRGGQAYGASDKTGGYVDDKPVSPEAFGATLLHALGIDPGTRLAPDGFTRPASAGTPVHQLFG